MDQSWILDQNPPLKRWSPEHRLWWHVIRQAVLDLRYAYDSLAVDAIEFLRSTGEWLAEFLFGIRAEDYRQEIASVLYRRNRSRGRELRFS